MRIRFFVGTTPLLAMLLAGCSGLSAPPGIVWQIVAKTGANGRNEQDRLADNLRGYYQAKLPLTTPQFVDLLKADHFQCDNFGQYRDAANQMHPETVPIGCWYFEKGPLADGAASCSPGAAVAVQITFQSYDKVTHFELKEISFSDPAAHGTGLCMVL